MNKSKIGLCLILLTLTLNIYSQNYPSLIISLKEEYTGDKISKIDSLILSNTKDRFIFKDIKSINGEFLLKNIKPSNYKLKIYCLNYKEFGNDVNITYAYNQRFYYKLYKNNKQNYGSPIYVICEEPPEFPGGDKALIHFINHTLDKSIVLNNKKKIFIQFIIDTIGKVDSVIVLNNKDDKIKNEAERMFNLMPLWKPGKQGGKAVDVLYTIPIY